MSCCGKSIKVNVTVEIPEELWCDWAGGQYDNWVHCQFAEWINHHKKFVCQLFEKDCKMHEHLQASPCDECLLLRKKIK